MYLHINIYVIGASLVAQTVKRLPAMRETQVRSLGREDPLEKEMAIYSSTLAWKIPWTEEPDRLQSMGLQIYIYMLSVYRIHIPSVCMCLVHYSVTELCPLFANPWIAACHASLFFTNSQSLLKLVSIELVMVNHLILCCPLPLMPSVFPSIKIISSELALHIRWPKFQLQHQSFQ